MAIWNFIKEIFKEAGIWSFKILSKYLCLRVFSFTDEYYMKTEIENICRMTPSSACNLLKIPKYELHTKFLSNMQQKTHLIT